MLAVEVKLMGSAQPLGQDAPGADIVLAAVSRHLGGLTQEDVAAVYGSVAAQRYAPGTPGVSADQVTALGQALGAFRAVPCPYCHLGLADHTLDLTPEGLDVRCGTDQSSRSLHEWLTPPAATSAGGMVWAVILWIGIPLVSLGFLSWAMPAVGAGLYRRWSWVIAAVALLILTVVGISVTPLDPNEVDPLADALFLVTWLGGAGYGAFQIKPWLNARSHQQRPA
jgi:hypothetical protein